LFSQHDQEHCACSTNLGSYHPNNSTFIKFDSSLSAASTKQNAGNDKENVGYGN